MKRSRPKAQQDFVSDSPELNQTVSGLSENLRKIVAAIRDDFNKLKKDLIDQLSEKNNQIAALQDEVSILKITIVVSSRVELTMLMLMNVGIRL